MARTNTSRTTSGLNAYSGNWGEAEILHLLKRVHFGVRIEDVNYFKTKTLNQTIAEILTIDYAPPAPPINNYNDANNDPVIAPGQTWVGNFNSLLNGVRMASFKRWWTGELINHDRTVREKLVMFWHNHFATQTDVYNWPNYAYDYTALLRANASKNFKTLTKLVTLDAAMLVYLNGDRNTKVAPDENYSRELQELFTLGKGPDSNYTESDVIQGAKVLTGWRINRDTGVVYFDDTKHDTTNKTFSSFYNNTTINGQTGANGAAELDDLLDMIFNQEEVSKHFARKLYRWFVYYDIDETTEENVILPLAAILRSNNYEVKPVLEALFKSAHFFDTANRGALIKSPIDFTVGLCRIFDIKFPPTDYVLKYDFWNIINYNAAIQQQKIGDPPSVSGWPAYYQIPLFHEIWINSDTLPNRNKISDVLITYGYTVRGTKLTINVLDYAAKFSSVAYPVAFINEILPHLHTLEVSQDQKDYMRSILLSGQVEDHYWTDAWNLHKNDPNNTTYQTVVGLRLVQLIQYLMNLAEFQLS
jgi:hypothetical protein